MISDEQQRVANEETQPTGTGPLLNSALLSFFAHDEKTNGNNWNMIDEEIGAIAFEFTPKQAKRLDCIDNPKLRFEIMIFENENRFTVDIVSLDLIHSVSNRGKNFHSDELFFGESSAPVYNAISIIEEIFPKDIVPEIHGNITSYLESRILPENTPSAPELKNQR